MLKSGHFIVSLQVKNEGVKLPELVDYNRSPAGFGTSECAYCPGMHPRIEMERDPEVGWYKPECKEKLRKRVLSRADELFKR